MTNKSLHKVPQTVAFCKLLFCPIASRVKQSFIEDECSPRRGELVTTAHQSRCWSPSSSPRSDQNKRQWMLIITRRRSSADTCCTANLNTSFFCRGHQDELFSDQIWVYAFGKTCYWLSAAGTECAFLLTGLHVFNIITKWSSFALTLQVTVNRMAACFSLLWDNSCNLPAG